MHDINAIIADPAGFDAALARRGVAPTSESLIAIDAERRAAITAENADLSEAKAIASRIGTLIREGATEEVEAFKARAHQLRQGLVIRRAVVESAETRLRVRMSEIPNLPAADVPDGADDAGNVLLRTWRGRPSAGGKEHFEIGDGLRMMDFERARRMSGPRFVVLRGHLAKLSRALGQFMLDVHVKRHGYCEVEVPLIVGGDALTGTGQLPKFTDDLYRLAQHDDEPAHAAQYLIPTAEVPLTNLVADEILKAEDLPLRFVALTPCFRSEAGSAGRDTRGMLRQHQFNKVELVTITEPDRSEIEHERMLASAEVVLRDLELPFRIVTLCAGDMGFSAQKTYDIEVWLPGQNAYREISSISNCGAFQARRMKARMKGPTGKTIPVHTLNGSGVAVGRALIAIMENYQDDAGRVAIPEVLRYYMDGLRTIDPEV